MGVINNLIYFNNNATTQPDDRVLEAMLAAEHAEPNAVKAAAALSVSRLINCKPSEVFFTAGTTPSIHLGIAAAFNTYKHKGNHIITSAIEHGEVFNALNKLKEQGADVTYLPVNREGLISPEQLEAAIQPSTILVSIMAANNHTGVIQPLEKVAAICNSRDILFFSDASQFVGKMRCDVAELGADCIAFGAHKMYGPKQAGVLFVKDTTALYKTMQEGYKHEIPPGNTLLAGLAKTADIFELDYWDTSAHISKLKNYLEHQLLDIEGFRINGSTRYRLYTTSNLTFPATKNIRSLANRFKFLDYDGDHAYVLKAMGLTDEEISNSFRFSFGKYNTLDEVKLLTELILAL